jgi:U3 small nucleolar RNA-associated protein MPP10
MKRARGSSAKKGSANDASDPIDTVLRRYKVEQLTSEPLHFVTRNIELSSKMRRLTKDLFDLGKKEARSQAAAGPLPELIIDNFDDQQIWEELQLQNHAVTSFSQPHISAFEADATQATEEEEPVQDGDASRSSASDGAEESDRDEDGAEDAANASSDDEDEEGEAEEGGLLGFGAGESHLQTESDLEEEAALAAALDRVDDDPDDFERLGLAAEEEPEQPRKKRHAHHAGGEPKFLVLSDMERFVNQAEEEENARRDREEKGLPDPQSEGEEDEDEDAEDGDGDVRYEDFFDPPPADNPNEESSEYLEDDDVSRDQFDQAGEQVAKDTGSSEERASADDEDDSGEGDELGDEDGSAEGAAEDGLSDAEEEEKPTTRKSRVELEKEAMQKKIASLEEANMAPRPWQLLGEVTGVKRPQGSLLEVHLDFEHATKIQPLITPEITASIEELIKQRVVDTIFDDPVRKAPLDEKKWKPPAKLSDEKSKQSLGEIYEEEYLRQTHGVEKPSEVNASHEELSRVYKRLCLQLDAICHAHYTPKAPVEDMTIKNVPAIAMEETTPLGVSNAQRQTPAEVYSAPKSLKSTTEFTREDRHKAHKARKHRRHMELKEKAAKQRAVEALNPSLKKKESTKDADRRARKGRNVTVGTTTSGKPTSMVKSKAFFQQMQENAALGNKPTVAPSGKKDKAATLKL